ncbi:hypothetical protein NW754_016029 [Fusarium falciforme]|nr:hypothetical protein NW754_016029 [Fusarium falciforme]
MYAMGASFGMCPFLSGYHKFTVGEFGSDSEPVYSSLDLVLGVASEGSLPVPGFSHFLAKQVLDWDEFRNIIAHAESVKQSLLRGEDRLSRRFAQTAISRSVHGNAD